MLKSVDTVGYIVVSATLVCRIHPYAAEILISLISVSLSRATVSGSFAYCKHAGTSEILYSTDLGSRRTEV